MLTRLKHRVRTVIREGWCSPPENAPGPALIGLVARIRDEWHRQHQPVPPSERFGLDQLLAAAVNSEPIAGPAHTPAPATAARAVQLEWIHADGVTQPIEAEFFARQRYAVGALTSFDDATFVEVAFRCLLKRPSDPSGYSHYLKRLREGAIDRIDVLAALRSSEEGASRNVVVEGLTPRRFWRRAQRAPVAGPLIAWGHALARLPRLARQHRALEARTAAWQQHGAELAAQVDARMASIAASLATIDADRAEFGRVVPELSRALQRLDAESVARAAAVDAVRHQQDWLRGEIHRLTAEVDLRATSARFNEIARAVVENVDEATRLQSRLEAIDASLVDASKSLATDATRASERINRLEVREAELSARVAGVSTVLEPIAAVHQREQFSGDEASSLEGFYDGLEARFRGGRAEIMSRFTPYLTFIRDAAVATADLPLIDLGCGRGEWLELLKLNHLHAYGVDASQVAVDHCHANGLAAECADVLAYLRATKSNMFGAVSALHVVEHLSFKTLVLLVREIHRVLVPGGLLLFETPNPENLFVAAYAFRMDPTHRVPLPPPMLEYLVESQGFEQPTVLRMNAGAYGDPFAAIGPDSASREADASPSITTLLRNIVEQHLYSAPDFAVIARKPGGLGLQATATPHSNPP